MKSSTRFAAFVFVGVFLAQAAWIIAVPPFRGSDEFDHAYRAAAVADGHWLPTRETVKDGRGELVEVPEQLVTDAEPECTQLPYPGKFNCNPAEHLGNGKVKVASAAARYNPVYYWVIGTPAKPFDGAASLYAMRTASALLCALVVALAAAVTARWATTLWPKLAFMAVLTPVMIYSNSVPAPNGLEVSAALGVWTALLGAARVSSERRSRFILAAAAFAVPMAGVRGLGPLFLLATCAVVLVLVTPRRAVTIVRESTAACVTFAVAATAVAFASAWWTLYSKSMELEAVGDFQNSVGKMLIKIPLWSFQSIAAFPLRNEPAPIAVYALGGLVVVALIVAGARAAFGSTRWALLASIFVATAVPLALEYQSFPKAGDIWQGRYGWPITLGVLMLCGYALDQRPPRWRALPGIIAGAWALNLAAQLISVVNVLLAQQKSSPLSGDPRWLLPHLWVVVPLMVSGIAVLAYSVHGRLAQSTRESDDLFTLPQEAQDVSSSV